MISIPGKGSQYLSNILPLLRQIIVTLCIAFIDYIHISVAIVLRLNTGEMYYINKVANLTDIYVLA